MKLPISLQVPETVYGGEWIRVEDSTRWAIAKQLGLPDSLEIAETQGAEVIDKKRVGSHAPRCSIHLSHPEKSLAHFPITKTISLWRELLPHPFTHFENTPEGLQFQSVDAALLSSLKSAYSQVGIWEQTLEMQELSALVILDSNTDLVSVIGFQTVRKKRIRMGRLQGKSLEWVKVALASEDTAASGIPKMHFFTALVPNASTDLADTPISTSWDSTACPLPTSVDFSHPSQPPIRPEFP